MKVIPPTYEEVAFRQLQKLIWMNPLMLNDYYSQIIEASRMLLDERDQQVVDGMVKEIEGWLSDDLNQMNLLEIETRMFQNLDLLSGFEIGGRFITQMEINERLAVIKQFIMQRMYAIMPQIRFVYPLRVD